MKTIRIGTFETNSSSTHSITIFDENDEEWQEELEKYINEDGKTYYSYEDFNDYDYMEYETYEDSLKTQNGETVVAFGYYGQDM